VLDSDRSESPKQNFFWSKPKWNQQIFETPLDQRAEVRFRANTVTSQIYHPLPLRVSSDSQIVLDCKHARKCVGKNIGYLLVQVSLPIPQHDYISNAHLNRFDTYRASIFF
jgi:hypothetical protein